MGKTPDAPPQFLTIAEAAQYLHVSQNHVRNMIYAGKIPVLRLGDLLRIRHDDLIKLIDENTSRGGAA